MQADMRDWRSADPFDLVIAPCSSLAHLLTLDASLEGGWSLASWTASSSA
jgi:hypothetical protein